MEGQMGRMTDNPNPVQCDISFKFCGVVVQNLVSFLACNHLAGNDIAGCFTLIDLLMPCCGKCLFTFPHGAFGKFAVCDCDISWSYSLTLTIHIINAN